MKVFLSYAREDRDIAHQVAHELRGTGHDVYPDAHWPQDIGAALGRADAFVVLLSPDAVGSPFINQEIKLALVSKNLEESIVPVVLKRATQVPWILQTMQPIKATPERLAKAIDMRIKKLRDRARQ